MAYNRAPNVVLAGRALNQNPPAIITVPAGVVPVILDVDIATSSTLGVVQIGDNLTITASGVLSANSCDCDCKCNCITIKENYKAKLTDCYIGANLREETELLLPLKPPNCLKYIVKLEYGAPVGNRKLKIKPQGASQIDGASSFTLTTPYQSVTLIANNGTWYII